MKIGGRMGMVAQRALARMAADESRWPYPIPAHKLFGPVVGLRGLRAWRAWTEPARRELRAHVGRSVWVIQIAGHDVESSFPGDMPITEALDKAFASIGVPFGAEAETATPNDDTPFRLPGA